MEPIWIVSARRTPQGRFLGSLMKNSAVDLGVAAGQGAMEGLEPDWIDQVMVGNVLGAGLGMNVARQIGVKLGLPLDTPAFTVNMMCASGMQAVQLAAQAVRAGAAEMILCGGTESMSNAPYVLDRARSGYKLGNGVIADTLLKDGLTDAFSGEHMGLTAERLAEEYGISRAEQDAFAALSQRRCAEAQAAGCFDAELVRMEELEKDEHPRADSTAERLAGLKPSFNVDGTVTPGNASGINDGAAMLVVCSPAAGRARGLKPMMVISAMATAGCDPARMGLGPVHAVRKFGPVAGDFEMVELNEAFAAQALACIRELSLDPEIVNPDGGAIALGHPIGASGARLLVHLAHRRPLRGLAALCVGGGMGAAMVLERPEG